MKSWRIQLQSLDGQLPNTRQCLARCLVTVVLIAVAVLGYMLTPALMVIYGLTYLYCLVDKGGSSLHDRLTGTRVLLLPKHKSKQASQQN